MIFQTPTLTLITINYNGKKLLKECLDSCFGLDYPGSKFEVILVDNSSTDGSIEFVKTHYPQVKIILSHLNNYCYANNLGIKAAKGDYIALINNDVRLEKNWLKEMLLVAQRDSQIGALTGKILFPDGRINSTGHVEFPNFYWADRGFKEEDRGQYDQIEELQSISHCACLYRKSCLKDIGPLDEDFNMYLEDVDMSIRAKKKNWRLYYVPTAISEHKFHGTAKDEMIKYQYEKNRLFLVVKHQPDKFQKAIFNDGYFSIAGKLDKDFLFLTLNEIKRKLGKEEEINFIKRKIENFHRSKVYRYFVRPTWWILDAGC